MSDVRRYDLYSDRFKANPYLTYAAMRREAPVFQQLGLDGETPIWFVTRYEDVEAVLLNNTTFVRDPRSAFPPEEVATWQPSNPVFHLVDNHMLNKDGDEHRRLRTLVSKAFTPRMVRQMNGRIQAIADSLINDVLDAGEMDLIDAFAFPLPITVIAELLGIPVADRDRFRVWSNTFVTPALTPEAQAHMVRLMQEFVDYLQRLFADRRASPRADLISALIQAEEAGETLSEQELYSMVILLIIAGHETTVNLIGNGVLALLRQREKWEELVANPDLAPAAVEELLRLEPPVERALARWVAKDTELGGQQLRRGELLIAIIGSAHRDTAQFAQPDEIDFARDHNRHLAFGKGVHYCLGAPLARLEGEIALRTLSRRLPTLRLNISPYALTWRTPVFLRGVAALPVAWDPA